MNKHLNKFATVCIAVLMLCIVAVPTSAATDAGEPDISDGIVGQASEVKVPVVIDLDYAIAGAEFLFTHTSGLEFVAFEPSETTQQASLTPVARRNDRIQVGFYYGSNSFEPKNGRLEAGNLVFHYSGEENQSVTISEAKYVEVIDIDNTNGQIIELDMQIKVPGGTLYIGDKDYTWLIVALIAVSFAAAVIIIILFRKKSQRASKER